MSLVSVVCCQVKVSTSGRSLVQRIPTGCGWCGWVWSWNLDNGMHWSICHCWPTEGSRKLDAYELYLGHTVKAVVRWKIKLIVSRPASPSAPPCYAIRYSRHCLHAPVGRSLVSLPVHVLCQASTLIYVYPATSCCYHPDRPKSRPSYTYVFTR